MKTIKIIDLLNKIANGEEVPRYIRFDTEMYSLNPNNHYVRECGDFIQRLDIEYNLVGCLNDEVEIIDIEEWKVIDEFPNYEISTKGNIRTKEYVDARNHIRQSKLLNKQVNNIGYEYVILSNEIVKHKTLTVHRLMAKTFLDDYSDTLNVNHINGIKTDNRIENLEMVTHSENIKKRYEIGIDGNNYKAVEQYDLDGNYIATYKSSYEAEKITNICRTSIGSCCRKEEGHYTAGGYIWKFEEEKEIENIPFDNEMTLTMMEMYRQLEKYNYKINELIDAVNSFNKGK